MARPTKYNPKLVEQISGFIRDGLTIRDACFGAGISEDTFWRWNREKLEFAEVIKQATAKQNWSSTTLAHTSEYRRYIRKAQICSRKPLNHQNPTRIHLGNQKLQNQAITASEGISGNKFDCQTQIESDLLPIRLEPPTNAFGELIPSKPYYNQTTHKVEWVEKELYGRCVLHHCSERVWSKMSRG